MKFIGDFHIHSRFSIATSKQSIPEFLDYWARVKGITVIGTGDFTHPGWIQELKEKLEPSEDGLFRLKHEFIREEVKNSPWLCAKKVRFLLTSEISSIYKKMGKVRKVHNVIFAPDFTTVEKIQHSLTALGGNITSDGRPILGLDSHDLLELALEASENILFIPAHIWTPWFSVLGSKSGFDTVEECFDDLSDHIYACETGLSSDPAMNWLCSFLDRYTLISNSDAHSPEKLGREANIFDTDLSYPAITEAIKTADPEKFCGTVEFFPQEGKYHYDGHRKCAIRWDPVETLKNRSICSVCNKKVTVGVMNRVVQLSDRETVQPDTHIPFYSVIPLKELLSEIEGVGPNTKHITTLYHQIVEKAGSEFNLLLNLSEHDIRSIEDNTLAEAIRRMRSRTVHIEEGFDGEYGRIRVFYRDERNSYSPQESLFDRVSISNIQQSPRSMIHFDLHTYRRLMQDTPEEKNLNTTSPPTVKTENSSTKYHRISGLNSEQQKAATHSFGPAIVLAGPGTGKTHVLTSRIVHLIQHNDVEPDTILAVTFTNKAAEEMRERIDRALSSLHKDKSCCIITFHAFGYSVLKLHHELFGRKKNFILIDEDGKRELLLMHGIANRNTVSRVAHAITTAKQLLEDPNNHTGSFETNEFAQYEDLLRKYSVFDLDDCIYQTASLFSSNSSVVEQYRNRYQWLCIDEYQDINHAQYSLMKHLLGESCNLFVIGDPNQAIYGFRGADVSFIKRFIDDFPHAAIYTLKKSYRCSRYILEASGQIISDNRNEDVLLESLHKGLKITIQTHPSDKSEAEGIARTIERMIGGTGFFSMDSAITEGEREKDITSLSDFAVLCRISRQMNAFEKAFCDHGIPYQKVETIPFFKQKPVKTILDILKLSRSKENIFLRDAVSSRLSVAVPRIISCIEHVNAQALVKDKIRSIIQYFDLEEKDTVTCLKRLIDLSGEYKDDVDAFCAFTTLGTGQDTFKYNTESVSLLTIHAAKGLEFQCVFIPGCEEGILPYSLFKGNSADSEEEKRLLYVGMTRAKKYLFLSHAHQRSLHGKAYTLPRSLFLDRIEKTLFQSDTHEYKKKKQQEAIQLNLFK